MLANLVSLFVKVKMMAKISKTNVGSGLSDDNRDQFWKRKDDLIGQIVEVRADAVTKNPRQRRHIIIEVSRFMRFRGSHIGENCNDSGF